MAQNIYFKPYFCLPDTDLAVSNVIYELLRLAEKPVINFLMPAISSKTFGLGFTIIKVSNTKNKEIKGVQKFRNWSRDLSHQNTCTLCCGLLQNFAMYVFSCNYRPISHRFRDKRRILSKIARKSPIFRTAVHLTPLLNELGIDAGFERN